jgi:hypothetical protein
MRCMGDYMRMNRRNLMLKRMIEKSLGTAQCFQRVGGLSGAAAWRGAVGVGLVRPFCERVFGATVVTR